MSAGTGKGVKVPGFLECYAVLVDELQKEEVQKPEVCRITAIKAMQFLESNKKSPPAADKLRSYFNPQMLNPSFSG
jgi:hypothetical protein